MPEDIELTQKYQDAVNEIKDVCKKHGITLTASNIHDAENGGIEINIAEQDNYTNRLVTNEVRVQVYWGTVYYVDGIG